MNTTITPTKWITKDEYLTFVITTVLHFIPSELSLPPNQKCLLQHLSHEAKVQTRHKEEDSEILKPYGFCCSPENVDPLTKYDDKNKFLYKPPLVSTKIINESPVLKFRTQFTGHVDSEQTKQYGKSKLTDIGDHKRKLYSGQTAAQELLLHSCGGSTYINLSDKRTERIKWGPIVWYIEDEIEAAKDALWVQKQKAYNVEMDRNTQLGSEKFNLSMKRELSKFPRWYQDFSIDQMRNLMMLQCVIRRDCEEMVSGRTERMLVDIGIMSTFFLLTPNIIRKLQEISNCNAIKFLREIYKVLTGNYFEEEEYKQFYDCNERIILSAIAFLTLPEAIMELHERLPPVTMPKIPIKPLPPTLQLRQKKESPYEEDLFVRSDWAAYYNRVQIWKARYQLLPLPKVILPPKECILTESNNVRTSREHEENKGDRRRGGGSFDANKLYQTDRSSSTQRKQKRNSSVKEEDERMTRTSSPLLKEQHKGNTVRRHNKDRRSTQQDVNTLKGMNKEESTFDIPQLPNGSKVFDFTINGVSEKPGPVEYKICGVLQPPQQHKKSWLGEKHPHYIISGAAEDPPSCPVTYEMSGVANVTPTNSDDKFFAILKLGDGPKKIYPSGRKNLSPKWQEWLQNVDEEYRKSEREMNKLIKKIEAITKLVFPGPKCDNCCSCRQSRKSYIKGKEMRAPYFVIDTIAEDSKKNKCIIGSMAMHSPAPTPPESTVNLLEVIASEDVLTSKLMINGVTNPKGETQYYISGITDEIIHQPSRIVERPPPRPPRNVPPCECAIQQISAKGLTPEVSHDHIPWTKQDGLCFGKKFRPHEAPAISCKMYPGDKSCRRNPFYRQIVDAKRRAKKAKEDPLDPFAEKRMYSIADFKPCGDEHGMGICGAPWGTLHTLTPQELEEQEKLRKQILRGPPCGTKAGRAVCKGPFGERIPMRKPVVDLQEIPGEFDEEEEEGVEEEVVEATEPVEIKKEKKKKRDQRCQMSPDSLASKQKIKEEKAMKKFIPDPSYPGYDDAWNIHRTAPSEKQSETDFKALLKLSSPKPPATPVESKSLIDDHEKAQPPFQEDTLESKKDKQKTASPKKGASKTTSKSESSTKTKIKEKTNKRQEKSIVTKSSDIRAKSAETIFKRSTTSDKTSDHKSSKQEKANNPRTKEIGKTTNPGKQISGTSSLNLKGGKGSFHEKSSKKTEGKSKPIAGSVSKTAGDNKSKISKKNGNPGNKSRSAAAVKKSNPNGSSPVGRGKKKESRAFNLNKKKQRRKVSSYIEDEGDDPKKQILGLKKKLMSPENYPPNVQPVNLPEEPPTKCTHEYGDIDIVDDSAEEEEETDIKLPSKGPCGWRTKSEQQLPTKKTLVYLSEPDYPPETIEVRPGGKPCVCRENREKKKVLMYNIGGLVGGKKDDAEHTDKLFKKKKNEEDKKLQVIEGIIYHTPPPSPRRSDEYVPEYDLYKSPYDMCLSKRVDKNLKYVERYSVPKSSASKALKRNEPCGCSEFVDTHDIQAHGQDTEAEKAMEELEKTRQGLVEAKPPKERWKLALNDVGLIDYYTRCRDSMPCWLKCNKFNKIGCRLPRARLVVKRPVCECKYERKILENKEEKIKWKERRQKLKSLKKQPFINVENTSKPVVADTKLMISGVKRIPREDEYIDDVKYCITGVVENYTEEPPKPVVAGVHMATPIQTPEPSIEEIPCVCLHRHWSPINVPPGPLPKPEELQRAEEYRRKKATEEAYKQIHMPDKVYDTHGTHSCYKPCHSNSASEDEDAEEDDSTVLVSKRSKHRRRTSSVSRKSKNDDRKRSGLQKTSQIGRTNPREKSKDGNKNEEKVQNVVNTRKKSEQKEVRDREKTETQRVTEVDVPTRSQSPLRSRSKGSKSDPPLRDTKIDSKEELVEEAVAEEDTAIFDDSPLMILTKNELKKMATEGFLFAKLPRCFLLPQLRYWLMYREGIALSNTDKNESVRKSIVMWNAMDLRRASMDDPPSLGMTKVQLRKLTFDDADKIKEQIAEKKALFHSHVRKDRVLYARSMWKTMDYGKFPDVSFKEAYFTYMASKEADGFVFKPWFRSDVRKAAI
ncbi:uncharacterized protein LOC143357637 [Halictus rubicundus]|uniref:uncharacterized protein LOC143357637 n=1 Tax=Halictus rubicundus TaxID=77578 RepID=UPI0040368E24